MKIEKASRKAIPLLAMFYGRSGSGKTYSALRLARGLVGPKGKICVIDSENGRSSYYANDFDFDVVNLEPPYTPARYAEAFRAIEKAGYDVVVIDSISQVWEGKGGCLDMAEGEQAKNYNRPGLNTWVKPKKEHNKLMNIIYPSKIHKIFCARSKDYLEQVKVIKNGKTTSEIVNKGQGPISEKNLPYEMLLTFEMSDSGRPTIVKCIKGLSERIQLKEGSFITEEHGARINDWINEGDKINFDLEKLKATGREEAEKGVDNLRVWFESLNGDQKKVLNGYKDQLKSLAINEAASVSKTSGMASATFDNGESLQGAKNAN